MNNIAVHEFASGSTLIRRAIDQHKSWIEAKLGCSLADAVTVENGTRIHDAAIPKLLGNVEYRDRNELVVRRFAEYIEAVELPEGWWLTLQAQDVSRTIQVGDDLAVGPIRRAYPVTWGDCPIAFRLRNARSPLIALSVTYISPEPSFENTAHAVIFRRDCAEKVLCFLGGLAESDGQPNLQVLNSPPQTVDRCSWDELVLDPAIISSLKNDFESFFHRQDWFRKMRLPFRRGYLLHGPPGNGKTTAVRAMLTAIGMTAYSIRLFDTKVSDLDIQRLFERAAANRPAMVLLEDIDRAFPRTGETKSRISLQQLLNSLDGVSSGEGIVTVATANEPAILDPAILRRPGRFDRVVLFPPPSYALRMQYFERMNSSLRGDRVKNIVRESDGFSFAQLREAYIIAGQAAFENKREINAEDVLKGVKALRNASQLASRQNNRTGFLD